MAPGDRDAIKKSLEATKAEYKQFGGMRSEGLRPHFRSHELWLSRLAELGVG
jgi:hypothetical protein